MKKVTKNTIIINVICCLTILLTSIGYSSYSKNLSAEEILATVNLEKEIKINRLSTSVVGGASSTGEQFSPNTVEGNIVLPYATSEIIYTVDILNLSEKEYSLISLTGLPDDLEYELMDYNLGEKICIEEGMCSRGITKPINIKIKYKSGTPSISSERSFKLDFTFALYSRSDVYISNITNEILKNGGESTKPPVFADTDASFEINTPNTDSTVEYDIIFQNDSKEIETLQRIDILSNNNSSNLTYEISGFKIGDSIAPDEAQISRIKFYVKKGTSIPIDLTQIKLRFIFTKEEWKSLKVDFLSESNHGNLNENDIVSFDIKVTNPNKIKAKYDIKVSSYRFNISDAKVGSTTYELGGNESVTHTIQLSVKEEVTYEKISGAIKLLLQTTYPISEETIINTITIDMPINFKSTILSSREITNSPTSYSRMEDKNGYLMRTNEIDDVTSFYYFRGVIDNNYVKFADKLWRITRVNATGNIRLVLNNNVTSTNGKQVGVKFSDKYPGKTPLDTVEHSIPLLDYRNSVLRTEVQNWYKDNIASHKDSKYIIESKYCADLNYESPITTSDGFDVYYFTSYIHVGKDFSNYHPKFACLPESIISENVGLLRAEEVFAAGGFWQQVNKNYYLYNQDSSDVSQTSWTISAAYYSHTEKEAGAIAFNHENGSIVDWVEGGNLSQEYGYRPVITLNGNAKITGDGTKDNPYQIVE